MPSKWPNIDVKEIFLAAKEARETGRFPSTFLMKPGELRQTLRELRTEFVGIQNMLEEMEQSTQETADRVSTAVTLIHEDYPKETEFLQVLVTNKLGSQEFQAKLINLMCELSNAKQGLLDPTKSVLVLSRYIDLLKEMKKDTELQDEVSKLISER